MHVTLPPLWHQGQVGCRSGIPSTFGFQFSWSAWKQVYALCCALLVYLLYSLRICFLSTV